MPQPTDSPLRPLPQRLLSVTEKLTYLAAALLLTPFLGGAVRGMDEAPAPGAAIPDMQGWSETRRQHYLDAPTPATATLAELEIPRLALRVPVFPDDSDAHLEAGAGVVQGMAYPDELGHIGIAAHRDSFFRPLKDIAPGDEIRLHTDRGPRRFAVEETRIIDPEELHWLQDTTETRLTLVTCYPFYFVGNAPQRFLVRATLLPSGATTGTTLPTTTSQGVVQ